MNTTCTIKTETTTKDSTGFNGTTLNAGVEVPCRVHDLKPEEAVQIYGNFGTISPKVFYFADDPQVHVPTKMTIVWGGGNYKVESVENQGGNLNRLWRVDATKKGA